MTTSDDVSWLDDSRLNKRLLHVAKKFLLRPRRATVKWDEAPLGGDDQFITLQSPLLEERGQRLPDDALALLKAIVDGGIDEIAAQLNSSHDGVAILGIRARIMLTQIGSKTNGGDLQSMQFAEMLLCDRTLQTCHIAGCAFRGCVSWKRHEHLLFAKWHD